MDVQREERAIQMKQERIQANEPLDLSASSPIRIDEIGFYNILSVEGGGIRGCTPTVWWMSLERKIRKPILSIIQLVAGTSTGAIIGAGLTTPFLINPSQPLYIASDIVELYLTKADEVLAKNSSWSGHFWTFVLKESKYINGGRLNVFAQYFRGTKLSETLSELLVAAVKGDSNGNDVFTRHGSRRDVAKDVLLTELIICTTAAPTYFPPYKLNNTIYIDGGVQANNPAMLTYDHALKIYRNCDKNRIRLLSLGTDDYIPDPLNPDASRNLFF